MSNADNFDFNQFAAEARSLGFDEVLERPWPALAVLDTHSHPFAARAMVVRGEMWLTIGDCTEHLRPGGRFELKPNACRALRP